MGVDATIINAIELAAGLAAVVSINESIRMAEISQDYAELYKEKETHYYNQFKLGAETLYVDDIWALPTPTFDFIGQRNRIPYNPFIGPMPGSANMLNPEQASEYSELVMLQARLYADIGNYLFAFEEERVRVEDDRRWEYRANALNIGLGVASDVRNRMSISVDFMDNTIGNSADALASVSDEFSAIAGFNRRLDTRSRDKKFDPDLIGRVSKEAPSIANKSSLVVNRMPP
jgi:hypothetical protein